MVARCSRVFSLRRVNRMFQGGMLFVFLLLPLSTAAAFAADQPEEKAVIQLKNISIELVMGWESPEKVPGYLDFIQANQEAMRKSITEIIPLDGVPEAFERLSQPNTEMKIMVEFD